MSRAARRPPMFAIAGVAFTLLLTACPPSRYRLADPPMRPGLGSEDRRCVLPPPAQERQPGHLDPFMCAAWTDRDQSAVHPHQWIFFPHFSIGATGRTARDCPQCVLDIQKGDRATHQVLTLRLPPEERWLARYSGQTIGGSFHGHGSLEIQFLPVCTGECADLFVAMGKVANRVQVAGLWREGFLITEGGFSGAFIHDDGERYEGALRYDPIRGLIPHGRGKLTSPDGDIYEGDLVDGVREGSGTWTGANGTRYEGEWNRGRRHGTGTATRADGSVYVGTFERDVRSGEGHLRMPDGTEHKGTFKAGVIHGPGVQSSPSGLSIEATWENGRLADGPGQIRWADRSTYAGTFQSGSPHGLGAATFPDGARYVGPWSNGRPNGRGAYVWPSGQVLVGEIVDGKVEGCALIQDDGSTWVGTFTRSEPVSAGCDRAPPTWSAADVEPLADLAIGRRALVDAWLAQRRTRAARLQGEERLPAIAQLFGDPHREIQDPQRNQVRLGLAWPSTQQQRFVHGSCITEGTIRLTVDGEREPARRSGLLDARVGVALPSGRTSEICLSIAGPCGSWRGCAAADTGSEGEPPGLVRVLLERDDSPPDDPEPAPPNGKPDEE